MHTAVPLHSFIHAHTYACIWPQVWRDVLVFVCVCEGSCRCRIGQSTQAHARCTAQFITPTSKAFCSLKREEFFQKEKRKKGQPQKIVRKLSGMLGTRGSTTGNIMQHRRLLQRADLGAERRYGFVSKTQLTGKPLFFLCVCVCVRACVRADCKRSKKACWDLSIQDPHHLFSAACIRTC